MPKYPESIVIKRGGQASNSDLFKRAILAVDIGGCYGTT